MFKVVPDQLRISEGWVRCGQCDEIFDASLNMQDPLAVEALPSDPVDIEVDAMPAPADGEPAPDATPDRSRSIHAEPSFIEQEQDVAPAPEPEGPETAVLTDVWDSTSLSEPAEPVPLSFMRQARKSSRWHRPLVRATLGLLSVVLALGLALQLLVQERDRIAAREPGLKPLIEEACRWLDCQVRPLREIDAVVIDSSAFTKVRGDMYRLSVTLKNRESVELAMPAIELSLTDALDVPLARRVLQPAELGVPSGVIPAASETQSALVLSVKLNGNGERVAGYRLLAFYP